METLRSEHEEKEENYNKEIERLKTQVKELEGEQSQTLSSKESTELQLFNLTESHKELEHEKASLSTQLANLQREKDQKVQELEREIERLKEDVLELQNEKEGIVGTKETVNIIH